MDIYMKIKLTIGLLYFLQTLTYIQGEYTYTYMGCYADNPAVRALSGTNYEEERQNTIESCVGFCRERDYRYAGLAYSNECYCGNSGYDRYGTGNGCNAPCTGNSNQICGGLFRNSVYYISEVIDSTTTTTSTTTTATSSATTYPTDTRTNTSNTPTNTVQATTASQETSGKRDDERLVVIVIIVGVVAALLFFYSLVVTTLLIREKRRSQNGGEQNGNVNDGNPSIILTDKTVTRTTGADKSCEYEEVDSPPVQTYDVYESMQASTSHIYGKLNRTDETEMEVVYEN